MLAREQVIGGVEVETQQVDVGRDVQGAIPSTRASMAPKSGDSGATGMAMIMARISTASRDSPRNLVTITSAYG